MTRSRVSLLHQPPRRTSQQAKLPSCIRASSLGRRAPRHTLVLRRGGTAPLPARVLVDPPRYRSPNPGLGKPMPWATEWWGPGGVPTGRMGRKFAITGRGSGSSDRRSTQNRASRFRLRPSCVFFVRRRVAGRQQARGWPKIFRFVLFYRAQPSPWHSQSCL